MNKYYQSHIEERRAYQREYQKLRRERERRALAKEAMNIIKLKPRDGRI